MALDPDGNDARRSSLGRHVHDPGRGGAVAAVPDGPRGGRARGDGTGARRASSPPSRASTPPSSARSTRSARGCCGSGPSRPEWTRASPRWTSPRTRRRGGRLEPLHRAALRGREPRSSRAWRRSASASRTCARPTRRSRTTRTSSRRSGPKSRRPISRRSGARSRRFSRAPAPDLPAEMPADGWTDFQEAVRRALRIVALERRAATPRRSSGSSTPSAGPATRARMPGRLRIEFETLCRDTIEPGSAPVARVPPSDPPERHRAGRRRVRRVAAAQRAPELPGPPSARARLSCAITRRSGATSRRASCRSSSTSSRTRTRSRPRSSSTSRAKRPRKRTGAALTPRPAALRRRRPEAVDLPVPPRRHRDLRRRAGAHRKERPRAEPLGQLPRHRPPLRLGQHRLLAAVSPPRRRRSRPRGCALAAQRRRGSSRRLSPRVADADLGHGAARRAGFATRIARTIEAAVARGTPAGPKTSSSSSARAGTCRTTRGSSRRAGFRTSSPAAAPSRTRRSSRTLLPLLQALSDPDDPVPFVPCCAGPLFGVDDEALYLFSRAGGRFSLPRRAARTAPTRGSRGPANSCGRARRSRPRCRPRPRSRGSADARLDGLRRRPRSSATAAPGTC